MLHNPAVDGTVAILDWMAANGDSGGSSPAASSARSSMARAKPTAQGAWAGSSTARGTADRIRPLSLEAMYLRYARGELNQKVR